MKVLVINGVNLNKLGSRSAEYGTVTLADIEDRVSALAKKLGAQVEFFVSNGEGEIVDKIQSSDADGIVINAGAYSHYSLAIADALKDKKCAKVEVHLTNIYAREPFRATSVLSPVVDGVISGFKEDVYLMALRTLCGACKA